jgi:c(7)-type cytochrome triheme protein
MALLPLAAALAATLCAPPPLDARASPVELVTPRVFGRVVLEQSSAQAGMPSVVFDHGPHRAAYACRVCHVDLGFAMRAGETKITAESNESGTHCGACHDGKRQHRGKPIFRACSGWPRPDPARGCTRCHSGGRAGLSARYLALEATLPCDANGLVDWAAALRRGVVTPLEHLDPGVGRAPMKLDRDLSFGSAGRWMREVTFSHRKHVAWTACEMCHPDVFPVTKAGTVRMKMQQIWAGQWCGACHQTVAFPLDECGRCHQEEGRRQMLP